MTLRTLFRKPSPLSLASAELEDAQRELLAASSAAEYAEAMVLYHTGRIERLRECVVSLADPEGGKYSENLGN